MTDDKILVARLKQGDESAFKIIVEKYQRKVYRMIYAMIQDKEDALEMTQELFFKVYRHIEGFQEQCSFYTWVYRIAMNLCIDYKRRRKLKIQEYDDAVKQRGDAIGDFPVTSVASRETPTARLMKEELATKIRQAMDKLPPKHRQVIVLREVEGYSYQEIAEILGISIGTVMSRLHHARKKMQRYLAPYLETRAQQ